MLPKYCCLTDSSQVKLRDFIPTCSKTQLTSASMGWFTQPIFYKCTFFKMLIYYQNENQYVKHIELCHKIVLPVFYSEFHFTVDHR